MSDFPQAHIDEVHALAKKAHALVREASSPAVALNALLTAYLNTADQVGALENVRGAGLALGSAAEQLLALRSTGAPVTHLHTPTTSIH